MPGAPAFCGKHRIGIWGSGGEVPVGEILTATKITWQRIRDNISVAQVDVPMGTCCDLLELIEPVQNEIHIYRDDEVVWIGVITRMEFEWDQVQIFAEDMLWVAKRRALAHSYNHMEPCLDCTPGPLYGTGKINAIQNAKDLMDECYEGVSDYWNMVPFLHPIFGPCDPDSARQANAWATTYWLELDKLAEDYGLDYTVVGRDIYWWDVHLNWNEIAPLDPADIADYPRIVEYGNSLATRYIRTDGSGYAGFGFAPQGIQDKYGPAIDTLSSEKSQADANPPRYVVDGDGNVVPGSPILPEPPSAAKLATWTDTAERRLEDLYPVRRNIVVPAGSTLMPSSPWDVNTLMPGSWTLATVDRLCRGSVSEYQRLHELRVTETGEGGETVSVSFVSAPSVMVLPDGTGCPDP